jgi:surface antigen
MMRQKLAYTRASKTAALALSLALAIGIFSFICHSASAQRAPNPYPFGKSTYWAWQNRPDLPANLGEAKNWNENAAAQGWPVGPYPRTGDIAVFEPGVLGADRLTGHVAIVRQVFDNGAYTTTQMDEADCQGNSPACGRVNTRQYPIAAGVSFIHYLKDTRTTWGFASGASGWTPINLGQDAPDSSDWYYPLIGGSPQLTSPDLDIPLQAYNSIEIQMATSPSVTDPRIQIYFATATQPQFSSVRSAWLGGNKDGSIHTYNIYFRIHPEWKGQLTRLRLDPAGAGTSGGVRIQRIRLLNDESPVFAAIYTLRTGR